jgi:starch-binding outer membrane protein SusE/F
MRYLQIQTLSKILFINPLNFRTMNIKIYRYLTFIGLLALLFSCEKDGDKVIMSTNPIAPELITVPNLTLQRANGMDTLVFIGKSVDPGFQASATYLLEASAKGTNFAAPISVLSGVQDTLLKITVSDFNGIMLKKFPAYQVTPIDLRIRSVLTVDAGTGAPGTSTEPFEYISETKSADVTLYGLPRLDLINSGLTQHIESPLGDGKYSGFVKLDKTKSFTFNDPEANIAYGDEAGKLAVNGAAINPSDNGWFKLAADTKALTYKQEPYMIGLVGSATPNSWNTPDQKMDYDSEEGCWVITIELKASLDPLPPATGGIMKCELKFRLNDGWAWNLGGTPDKLTQGGPNLIVAPGNYTIKLFINSDGKTGRCTLTLL